MAARRAVAIASSAATAMTSSKTAVSRISGTKPAPMPCSGWGPLAPPDSTGEAAGSTATICTEGLRALRTCPTPVMVPPVPTPDDQDVDLPVGVGPDLLRGGLAVDLGVGRVGELLGHEPARVRRGEFLGLGDRPGHARRAWRQHQVGAVGAQQQPPLGAHRLRHRQHAADPPRGAHHRQRDPGVAAGRLHHHRVRADQPRLLGGVDHRHPDPVLHPVRRVEELQLGHHLGRSPVGDLADPYQRGVAHQLRHVVRNSHVPHCARCSPVQLSVPRSTGPGAAPVATTSATRGTGRIRCTRSRCRAPAAPRSPAARGRSRRDRGAAHPAARP